MRKSSVLAPCNYKSSKTNDSQLALKILLSLPSPCAHRCGQMRQRTPNSVLVVGLSLSLLCYCGERRDERGLRTIDRVYPMCGEIQKCAHGAVAIDVEFLLARAGGREGKRVTERECGRLWDDSNGCGSTCDTCLCWGCVPVCTRRMPTFLYPPAKNEIDTAVSAATKSPNKRNCWRPESPSSRTRPQAHTSSIQQFVPRPTAPTFYKSCAVATTPTISPTKRPACDRKPTHSKARSTRVRQGA